MEEMFTLSWLNFIQSKDMCRDVIASSLEFLIRTSKSLQGILCVLTYCGGHLLCQPDMSWSHLMDMTMSFNMMRTN